MRFWNRDRKVPSLSTADSIEQLKAPYTAITRTHDKLRPPEVRMAELIRLAEHPGVVSLGFARGFIVDGEFKRDEALDIDWLLIGTPYIRINHEGNTRAIGEFIIYFSRFGTDNTIDPKFYVENVTPSGPLGGPCIRKHPVDSYGTSRTTINPHPHCDMGNIATFCMSAGKNELQQALCEGTMFEAFRYIYSALRSYGPDKPVADIEFWPIIS